MDTKTTRLWVEVKPQGGQAKRVEIPAHGQVVAKAISGDHYRPVHEDGRAAETIRMRRAGSNLVLSEEDGEGEFVLEGYYDQACADGRCMVEGQCDPSEGLKGYAPAIDGKGAEQATVEVLRAGEGYLYRLAGCAAPPALVEADDGVSVATVLGGLGVLGAAATIGGERWGGDSSGAAPTIAPKLPNAPSVGLLADTGGSSTDKITSNAALSVAGIEAAALVQYQVDGGAWASIYAMPTTNATHTVVVRQIDTAGNTSVGDSVTFTLDTTVAAPTVRLTSDTGGSSTDKTTSNAGVSVMGTEFGALVQYQVDGGAWASSYTAPTTNVAHTVAVRQIDTAGNTSAASENLIFTLDTTIATPTVELMSDTGSSNTDKVTSNAMVLAAAAEPGALVQYQVDGGAWASSYAAPTTDAAHTVAVRQIDTAGNTSPASSLLTFTLDTTAAAPTVSLTNDSGGSALDQITSTAAVSVAGTESGALVQYQVDGGAWASSYIAPTTDVVHTVAVRQIDTLGHVSVASTDLTFTLDTTAPTVSITDDVNLPLAAGQTVAFTFTFSEAVTGFDASDVLVKGPGGSAVDLSTTEGANGWGTLSEVDSTHWTVSFTAGANSSDGNLTLEIKGAPNFEDTAGNLGSDAPSHSQRVGSIDLGSYGKLIAPVEVDGHLYYYWDRSGDGTTANSGPMNSGDDFVTHFALDALFNGGVDTTDDIASRTAVLNGVTVRLPMLGDPLPESGFVPGTPVNNNPGDVSNPTYDEMLAIWDAYNGAGTGINVPGVPENWRGSSGFWSASLSSAGNHYLLDMSSGLVIAAPDGYVAYVALEVL